MKKIIIIIVLSIVSSCKTDSNTETELEQNIESSEEIQRESKNIKAVILPKYNTVKEMLLDANDFSEENNTLKFISTDINSLHVQVSKPILQEDLESVKEEIVKRDIVYVAFQTFAQTDINEITITAVPVEYDDYKKYVNAYKLTVKINREKARNILQKYLQSTDFSILYEYQNNLWLPGKNFNVLKFEKLNSVFNDILQ